MTVYELIQELSTHRPDRRVEIQINGTHEVSIEDIEGDIPCVLIKCSIEEV